MDKAYVSEFTLFMDKYLKDHPEVVKDQQRGWDIYWNPKAAEARQNRPSERRVTAKRRHRLV